MLAPDVGRDIERVGGRGEGEREREREWEREREREGGRERAPSLSKRVSK